MPIKYIKLDFPPGTRVKLKLGVPALYPGRIGTAVDISRCPGLQEALAAPTDTKQEGPSLSQTIRTITITEDATGVFIATSDDDPPLFCAATSMVAVAESIARVIKSAEPGQSVTNGDRG